MECPVFYHPGAQLTHGRMRGPGEAGTQTGGDRWGGDEGGQGRSTLHPCTCVNQPCLLRPARPCRSADGSPGPAWPPAHGDTLNESPLLSGPQLLHEKKILWVSQVPARAPWRSHKVASLPAASGASVWLCAQVGTCEFVCTPVRTVCVHTYTHVPTCALGSRACWHPRPRVRLVRLPRSSGCSSYAVPLGPLSVQLVGGNIRESRLEWTCLNPRSPHRCSGMGLGALVPSGSLSPRSALPRPLRAGWSVAAEGASSSEVQ